MKDCLIYQTDEGVQTLHLCDQSLDIISVGVSTIKDGTPFWFIDQSQLPSDRTVESCWELDLDKLGIPDGIGGAV